MSTVGRYLMPGWVKVMNSLRTHPKTLAASPEACWLYVCGLCWVNEHLTDGSIPTHVLGSLAPQIKRPARAAGHLVEAGLWHEVDGGWHVHDYLAVQRSSSEVQSTRGWDSKRKALFRDKDLIEAIRLRDRDMCRYCGVTVRWNDRRSAAAATYDHVIPRGDNSYENVVVACRACNFKKGARTPEDAGMPLKPSPIQNGTKSANQVVTQSGGSSVSSQKEKKNKELDPESSHTDLTAKNEAQLA